MLIRSYFAFGYFFSVFDIRQNAVVVIFCRVIFAFLIEFQESVKGNDLSRGSQ